MLYIGGESPIEDDIRPNVKPMHMEPAPRGAIWVIPPNFIPGLGSVIVRLFCTNTLLQEKVLDSFFKIFQNAGTVQFFRAGICVPDSCSDAEIIRGVEKRFCNQAG